jgi:hypothetical protein
MAADIRYTIKPEYTGPFAALSLGLTLLRKSKANTWAELTAALDTSDSPIVENLAKVNLSSEQIEILDIHGEVLQYLKILPPVQVALCICGLPYLVAGGAAPKTCLGDSKCFGVPIKPVAATIWKPEKKADTSDEDEENAEYSDY